jgi:hypothetical protein
MLRPAPQYRCTNLARARKLAADATFAGIEQVQVLTDDALAPRPGEPDIELRQRIVLFRLPNDVETGLDNPLLQGGVLITDLDIAWGASAEDLLNSDFSDVPDGDEEDQVAEQLVPLLQSMSLDEPDHVLVVRTEDPLFNGIDFLEVADGQLEDPESDLRQVVLLVHLFLPVPAEITGKETDHVAITGGSRITDILVEWAVSADELVNGDVSAVVPQPDDVLEELAPLLPTTDRNALQHILIVKTDVSGDFSPYELAIVDDSGAATFTEPFFGFDLQLARVPFSFKVDCPSDFDCLVEEECPPQIPQAPVIDYLAKDYTSFRTLMLDRMAQTIPEWKERNAADIGVTIVELLAFAADQLSYFQDAVANEAYLGTARERPSLRRHARLLDYTPREGTNARTFVHFQVAASSALEARTPLFTKTEAMQGRTVATDADLEAAITAGSHVFETMEAATLYAAHNEIHFYTWGDEDCCLPKGAVRATLRLRRDDNGDGQDDEDAPPLVLGDGVAGAIKPGALLALVERVSPNPGAPADPVHRHVVRLTEVRAGRDTLYGVDVVEIAWAREDALPFPLCLRVLDEGGGPVSVARGNIVIADHGHSVTQDLPLPTSPPGFQRFLPLLTEAPITFQAQVMDAERNLAFFDPNAPAASALRGDPRLARPDVILFPIPDQPPHEIPVRDCVRDLETDTNHWIPVRDLLESGPFSQHFVVEMENEGTAQLRFGDDQLGRSPTERLFACYRIGNGTAGNIGADGLVHVVTSLGSGIITGVTNVLPAVGGEDPEPAEEIRLSAPQAFRVQERAVTEADYAEVSARHPGVQRAVATRRFTGSWYTMFVAVDRLGGLPVDDAFKVEFANFLERFRMAGYDLEIQGAVPVPLEITLTVCVLPGFFRFDVKRALLEALGTRDLPDGRRGFFHPDNFTFGQAVFLSRVIAAALAVPGVGSIDTGADTLVFKRLRHAPTDENARGVISIQRLEIAQLDNDPSRPENGRLELVMRGGS